jgi:hypothetical protein
VSNSQDCYFWDEVVVTASTSSGGVLPTATSGSGQSNTASGNNRIIRAKPEAGSGTYGCYLNSFTVGSAGQCIKTIIVTYRNYTGESNPIYNSNPNFQYIVILPISSSAPPTAPTNVTYPAFCAGSSVTLTGTGTNAGSGWYTAGCNSGPVVGTGANISVAPSSATTYYVSNVECGLCRSVTVTPTALGAGTVVPSATSICDGSNLVATSTATTGTFTDLSYSFNSPGPPWTSLGNPSPFIWNSAGFGGNTAYLLATFNNGGCIGTAQTNVVIRPIPVTDAGNSCIGTVISLSASGGGTYSWSGPNGFTSTLQNPIISSGGGAAAGTYTVTVTGANGCSQTGTTTVAVGGSCTLPISLEKFSAICYGDDRKFQWITASELNNNFFTLEGSLDATLFDLVETISGAGNSNSLLAYEYVLEDSPFKYFRLKQTDFDGKFSYSEVITVDCNSEERYPEIVLSPNPATENITVDFNYEITSVFVITLKDLVGRTVKEIKYDARETSFINISLEDLNKGIYFIQMKDVTNCIESPLRKFLKE